MPSTAARQRNRAALTVGVRASPKSARSAKGKGKSKSGAAGDHEYEDVGDDEGPEDTSGTFSGLLAQSKKKSESPSNPAERNSTFAAIGPLRIRRLLLALLLTTLALVASQYYRLQRRGSLSLFPSSGSSSLADERIAYDSSQWKARVETKPVPATAKAAQRKGRLGKEDRPAKIARISQAGGKEQTFVRGGDGEGRLVDLEEEAGRNKLPITPEELKEMSMDDIQAMFDALQAATRERANAERRAAADQAEDGEEATGEEGRKRRFGRLRKAMQAAGAGPGGDEL